MSKILQRIMEILNRSISDELISLTAVVPKNLFYYSESLDNGCEYKLEDKSILIECTGHDSREDFTLNITIKEICYKEIELNYDKEHSLINLNLNYQSARKLLLDLIAQCYPHSVNLITR